VLVDRVTLLGMAGRVRVGEISDDEGNRPKRAGTSEDPRTRAAVAWLLGSGEPAIRLMTRRDPLGEQAGEDAGRVLAGARVTALLSGQQSDGGFGVRPYRKWTGAHWRLVSLVELAIPPREPRAVAAAGLGAPRLGVPRRMQVPGTSAYGRAAERHEPPVHVHRVVPGGGRGEDGLAGGHRLRARMRSA
jgi:hypothetical protein